MTVTKRIVYIDVLRVVAILGVIMIHTTAHLGSGFTPATELVKNALLVFTHFSINIFFMVSGAVILSKKYNWRKFYQKRLWRIVPALIILPLISIPFGTFTGHLWCLYAILLFYALSPIVTTWLDQADKKEILGVILVMLILAMLHKSWYLITQSDWIFDNDFFSYFILFIAGYYFSVHTLPIKKTVRIVIFLIIIALEFLAVAMNWQSQFFTVNTSPLNILGSIALFYLIKDSLWLQKMNDKVKIILTNAGDSVFGIYLLHMIILNFVVPLVWGYFPHIQYFALNALYKLVVVTLLTFGIGWVVVRIMRKISVLKWLI